VSIWRSYRAQANCDRLVIIQPSRSA